MAAFVPGYSGGTATDSHRLPYSPEATRPEHPCRPGMVSLIARIATDLFQAGPDYSSLKRKRRNSP